LDWQCIEKVNTATSVLMNEGGSVTLVDIQIDEQDPVEPSLLGGAFGLQQRHH
jgi:hypothetical protein